MNKVCFYHGDCHDGFSAAWIVNKVYGPGQVEFIPSVYRVEPPSVKGKDVIIVDFSFPLDTMIRLADEANSIIMLDHHESAFEQLNGKLPPNVTYVYDVDKCGAMVTWDFFYPDRYPPQLLYTIEDYDLWKLERPHTETIMAAVHSYEYDFDMWTFLMEMDLHDLRNEGVHIERKMLKDIRTMLSMAEYKLSIAGVIVPVCNLPRMWANVAGNILAKNEPFAATYWYDGREYHFSLRSDRKTGTDVSVIASLYGGGGHTYAAGFSVENLGQLYN